MEKRVQGIEQDHARAHPGGPGQQAPGRVLQFEAFIAQLPRALQPPLRQGAALGQGQRAVTAGQPQPQQTFRGPLLQR